MNSAPKSNSLLVSLGVTRPIFLSPMAGTGTVTLAAAVSNAGGLGALAVGAMSPARAHEAIAELRERTDRPFNINVFTHAPPVVDAAANERWLNYLSPRFAAFGAEPPASLSAIYPSFVEDDAMLDVLLRQRPPVVSFHFGLPSAERIAALRQAGCLLFATATSLEEAQRIEAAQVDVIVAQGIEAGGHRGVFDPAARDERLSTLALVAAIARRTRLPVVAAGGIMTGGGIAAALAAGAQAAQLGTVFIDTPESAADAAYRAALAAPDRGTALTLAISGRPARCLESRFTVLDRDPGRPPTPPYPVAYDAGKALNAAAAARGDAGFAGHWAGQGVALSRRLPAAQLIETLVFELRAAAVHLQQY
ncbi:nitronate monooxygenase family protein [Paraburkholderia sp. CNPSo 3281]|uniref:NAD(P)H-dependent flavin oxidoreductase n=1 Tax=Paraburkholderia sp. CNPSo 3281 TaxID=2940933 RepID=UPI0020B66D68|nr:nitronate monooxygenase [Paraburkholderia sp. CNPSo 3281]MCP3717390.1 nitronate monooxygenase [Paraburkholderia sp. CNPSo 3281]